MARNGTALFNTLQQLHDWKCALDVTCRRCKHRATLYLPSLIEQYGPTTELAEIVPKFVCGECGAQMANVEPMMQ